MTNELLFVLLAALSLSATLVAFRLGKAWLFAYIAVAAVAFNIFALKGIILFGLAVTGGNALYAATFLVTDILNEFYGRKEATKAVVVGFAASIFFLAISQITLAFTPADYDFAQGAFETLFTLTPRIVFGSMIAYLISQNLDVFLFEQIKKATKGKYLWLRNNGSTWVSQLVDSVIFSVIAFYGVFPLFDLILFTYVIKVVVAAFDTPFIYLAKKFKPQELR